MHWLRDSHPDLPPAELEDIAQQIINGLLTTPAGRVRYEAIPIKNAPSLKERTFSIPDEMVEDFLESDIDRVSRSYVRTLAPDVELAERFGRADMNDQGGDAGTRTCGISAPCGTGCAAPTRHRPTRTASCRAPRGS